MPPAVSVSQCPLLCLLVFLFISPCRQFLLLVPLYSCFLFIVLVCLHGRSPHTTAVQLAVMFFQAISVLCDLDDDIRSQFGACGTCETVFEMMRASWAEPAVQGYAMGPLRYLSRDSTANSVMMYQLSAFEAIVRVANDLRIDNLGRSHAHAAFQAIAMGLGDSGVMGHEELSRVVEGVIARLPQTVSR